MCEVDEAPLQHFHPVECCRFPVVRSSVLEVVHWFRTLFEVEFTWAWGFVLNHFALKFAPSLIMVKHHRIEVYIENISQSVFLNRGPLGSSHGIWRYSHRSELTVLVSWSISTGTGVDYRFFFRDLTQCWLQNCSVIRMWRSVLGADCGCRDGGNLWVMAGAGRDPEL